MNGRFDSIKKRLPPIERGQKNELIFLVENMPSAPSWSDPCIRLYDTVLNKGWRISQRLLREKEGWFNPGSMAPVGIWACRPTRSVSMGISR